MVLLTVGYHHIALESRIRHYMPRSSCYFICIKRFPGKFTDIGVVTGKTNARAITSSSSSSSILGIVMLLCYFCFHSRKYILPELSPLFDSLVGWSSKSPLTSSLTSLPSLLASAVFSALLSVFTSAWPSTLPSTLATASLSVLALTSPSTSASAIVPLRSICAALISALTSDVCDCPISGRGSFAVIAAMTKC